MASENAKIDNNRERTLLGVTDDASAEPRRLLVDPTTGRLKVSATGILTYGLRVQAISGTINGANVTFTVSIAPAGDSIISLNGQILIGGLHYSVASTTITYTSAPPIEAAGTNHYLISAS